MLQDVIRGSVAVVLIPALLAGCGGGGRRVSAPPTYGDVADLVAWVSVTPANFHPGETVEIEVGVRNPTPQPIIVAIYSPCFSYAVNDASGPVFAPSPQCVALAIPREIPPGEGITAQFSWDGTIPAGTPLPPGDYQVRSLGLPLYASATPVTIRILAP